MYGCFVACTLLLRSWDGGGYAWGEALTSMERQDKIHYAILWLRIVHGDLDLSLNYDMRKVNLAKTCIQGKWEIKRACVFPWERARTHGEHWSGCAMMVINNWWLQIMFLIALWAQTVLVELSFVRYGLRSGPGNVIWDLRKLADCKVSAKL